MFFKAFRVKSNTTMKVSERRKLQERVNSAYPSLTAEKLSWLIPPKEDLSILKVYAHKGDAVSVYMHKKNPIIFEMDGNLYPTVYTLWNFPDLLPVFTTWPPVLEKMAGGADLMLPGVVIPCFGLPEIQQGTLCSVVLVGNRAPVAIGVTTMSTKDMLASGMKGKGLTMLHTYKDELWAYGDRSSPPKIAQLELESESSAEQKQLIHQESGNVPDAKMENLCLGEAESNQPLAGEDIHENLGNGHEETSSISNLKTCSQEDMDDLLNQCFFHALKYKVKKLDLPLLTSTFLRNYLFACCPEGQHVDIKRSSYKKLSKFLQAMQIRKILEVKELSKGVESIVNIDWSHPDVRSFVASTTVTTVQISETSEDGEQQPYQFPEIIPLYGVTATMLPLFQESKHRKGDLLTQNDVRNAIMLYVKSNELVCPNNKNFVSVNPVICDCLLNKSEQHDIELLKWDELFTRCLERMQHSHQVTFPGQSPLIRKGSIDPIYISVAQRASNKKVTTVKNLELYGLDPSSFGGLLQQKAQASTSYTSIPGTKDKILVQIQGNQVLQIGRLLLDYFKIPRKYVSGLDLALKSRKKT